jgi:hypothetical protein
MALRDRCTVHRSALALLFHHDGPLLDAVARDDSVRHVRVLRNELLRCLLVREDKERPGGDRCSRRARGAPAEAPAGGDEILGQSEVSLAVRAALLQDVGDVVVAARRETIRSKEENA